MKNRPYLIFVYPFDQSSGGIIALYALCERLRALGETAALWPIHKPHTPFITDIRSAWNLARYVKHRPRYRPRLEGIASNIGGWRELRESIMIYPEVIAGNPSRAKHVVRWFLHKPGYHTGVVHYGSNEQYFFYQDAFNDGILNQELSNRLTVTWVNSAYRQTNFGERSGICYLLRKGKERAIDIDRSHVICVDDMSHSERSAVFNRFEYLVSYDLYSMYSTYAAMCGCTPIIVPQPGLSRDEWFPNPQDRLGLAYGWDERGHARVTRGDLMKNLASARAEEDEMVRRFVIKSQARFK